MKEGKFKNTRVLIVDDQPEIHDDFAEMLTPSVANPSADDLAAAFLDETEVSFLPEFELLHASNGEQACELIHKGKESSRPIALAYIDIRMPPGMDGVETIRRIRLIDREIEVVVMTAYTDRSLPGIVEELDLMHKTLYVRKPFTHEEIQQITLSLVAKWNIERELERKRRQLTDSHRRLEAVLNATGDAIAMYNVSGRLVYVNGAYERLLGMKARALMDLSSEDLAARFKKRFRELDPRPEKDGSPPDNVNLIETTGVGNEPNRRYFFNSAAQVRNDEGVVIGSLVVCRDVSTEHRGQRKAANATDLRRAAETTTSFAGMVGGSPEMRRVYKLMKRAAESDITVLIQGESGTGKELVARSFHVTSSRNEGPFVALDCAAIPASLIESELFGHEKGAFTGAITRRIGAFERADKGTIFFDEIGDLPLDVQAKLLRVLQEREIQRIGGASPIPVDIRIVTATNKNLENAVKAGDFREDLFYRVAAFPIMIPPLRKRREDIPLLAEHFVKRCAESLHKSIDGISKTARSLISRYDWPGNVRELENAIQRAVLLETSPVLQASNLPPKLSPVIKSAQPDGRPATVLPLAEVERQALLRALEAADNSPKEAADALGIHRTTLHRKMKKYNIDID